MPREKFIIEPHFRLQEWVAEEKGYFRQEGLDYVFQELIKSTDGAHHYKGDRVGAMQSFERGRTSELAEIGRDDHRAGAVRCEFSGKVLHRRHGSRCKHQIVTVSRQFAGEIGADAARCAGH